MSNDYDSAVWADQHRHVSVALAQLFKGIMHAFKRLNAIEYDAPWRYMRP